MLPALAGRTSIFDVARLVTPFLLVVAVLLTAIGIADHAFAALLLGIAGLLTAVLADVTGILALLALVGGLGRYGGQQGAGGQQGGAQARDGNGHGNSNKG